MQLPAHVLKTFFLRAPRFIMSSLSPHEVYAIGRYDRDIKTLRRKTYGELSHYLN
jgi:hypothetical protein